MSDLLRVFFLFAKQNPTPHGIPRALASYFTFDVEDEVDGLVSSISADAFGEVAYSISADYPSLAFL